MSTSINMAFQQLRKRVEKKYESLVWTHKIHEKQAEIYEKEYKVLKTINIIASAITTCGIVAVIFYQGMEAKVITALLSFVTTSLTTYLTVFRCAENSEKSKNAANRFIGYRNEMEDLKNDILIFEDSNNRDEYDVLKKKYDELCKRLNEYYKEAPMISDKAERLASIALGKGNLGQGNNK